MRRCEKASPYLITGMTRDLCFGGVFFLRLKVFRVSDVIIEKNIIWCYSNMRLIGESDS